jgi:short-subunit dehydrogenase
VPLTARARLTPGVAVVTGASSGIGEALARRLARDGWRCVLLARREHRLANVADAVDAEYEVCDVGDRQSVERAAAAVAARHARVGLLVNCAGIPGRKTFTEIEPELAERLVRTNYLGCLWCLRAFLPVLAAAAPDAHVVNVVSVAGTVALARSGPYSAAKHAQLAFSRATAAELKPRGIRVHTVNPGFVETEGFPQRALRESRFLRRAVIRPERAADAIVDAIENRRREVFVPRWYRIFAVAQAVVPGLVAWAGERTASRPVLRR